MVFSATPSPLGLQRVFIDTLKQIEPIDARILSAYFEVGASSAQSPHNIVSTLDLRVTEVIVSADRLASMDCLKILTKEKMGNTGATTSFQISALGLELYRACSTPPT